MLHSVTLHLCLRFHSLLMRRELKRVICWWMSFVCLLSFALTFDIELSECCVWFQCFAQRCCSTISNTVTCRYKEKKQVICWWMSFVCLLSFVFTPHVELSECCVWFQCFTQRCCSCVSNDVPCWKNEKEKRVICWCMPFVCLLSFVLTINTKFCECCVWHQCLTQWCRPCFSNLIACWCKEIEKEWIVDGCLLRVFFLLSLLSKSSSVSVGFDFSASHNDIVPVFLVPFPFYTTVKRKELFID